eukprot:5541744-Amphidinium_carterae.1
MAWNPSEGLKSLAKLLCGKSGQLGRKPKKGQKTGSDKGFGRSSTGGVMSWYCSWGKKQDQQQCEQRHTLREQLLRKQVAEAKDNPDLKEHLEAALAA